MRSDRETIDRIVRPGKMSSQAKLTEEDVLQMRADYATGLTSYNKLSRQYGVCHKTIWNILTRKKWAHIP
jgi:hypothetical protein